MLLLNSSFLGCDVLMITNLISSLEHVVQVQTGQTTSICADCLHSRTGEEIRLIVDDC